MMDRIEAKDLLPVVFREEEPGLSEVWRTEVVFTKGTDYLVEARSGGGKSSLCAYIYGLRTDYDGKILFDGEDVRGFGVGRWQELRRRSLAYLPQDLSLFPELTAFENIALKNSLTNWKTSGEIAAWLEELGIGSRRDFPVGKMSVGQQQRVGIIRALCQQFDFLLLDEPVSHLDETNNRIVSRIVQEEARRQGASVIATSVGNHLMLDNPLVLKL